MKCFPAELPRSAVPSLYGRCRDVRFVHDTDELGGQSGAPADREIMIEWIEALPAAVDEALQAQPTWMATAAKAANSLKP